MAHVFSTVSLTALVGLGRGACSSPPQPSPAPNTSAPTVASANPLPLPASVEASAASTTIRQRAIHTRTRVAVGSHAIPLDGGDLQNARDGRDRVVFAQGPSCFVVTDLPLPKDTPPARSKADLARQPPTEQAVPVDCPADYDDPAWDECPGDRILRHGDVCSCESSPFGNGPPPRECDCPALHRR